MWNNGFLESERYLGRYWDSLGAFTSYPLLSIKLECTSTFFPYTHGQSGEQNLWKENSPIESHGRNSVLLTCSWCSSLRHYICFRRPPLHSEATSFKNRGKMKPTYVGGSLSFKGDKKAKKKKSKTKHALQQKEDREETSDSTTNNKAVTDALDTDLTDAERKALKKRKERERVELALIAQKSHRERVEVFNEKLASVTEHNDIPRVRRIHMRLVHTANCKSLLTFEIFFFQVSAAGNG